MLVFENVSFSYGKETLIEDISFHLNRGEFAALIGENGAGKSTLSKLCIGLLKPQRGSVTISGMNTLNTKSSRIARHAGYLFQNPDRQICQNTVYNEIMFGLAYTVSDEEERKKYCEEIMERFQFLPDADPFRLSRGDRQRLALASILACHPEFLLLDEPTTGLDYRECMQLLTMMQELHQKGTTILMITHDMEIVQEFAQRVLVMTNGRLVADGATGDVMRETKTLKQASVMPSQMQELALELGDSYDGVYSVETMLARIDCLRRRRA